MKKITTIAIVLLAPFATMAENINLIGGLTADRSFVDGLLVITVMCIIITFILSIIRSMQEYRLKSKMMEKGVSNDVVQQFLQPNRKDNKSQAMKWFLVLTGVGLGLIVVHYNRPFDVHSVAIMALAIGLSFLGYYYFLRISEK